MNLTWHIVKKDLRALKWPLLLWIALIIAKLGVGVVLLNADGTEGLDWFNKMSGLAQVLSAFEFVSFVLTAAIIQQDLLVGTTAFWMTRPISGARLLRAKLIGIGLVFIVAPVLVTLPWWLGCHYGISEIGWAVTETVAAQAIAVLLGLLWSVVTDGFARFLMWTLVTLFATPMLTAIIAYYASRHLGSFQPELVSTRFLLVLLLSIGGIFVVVVHQFLTRNIGRSIAIIAGTVGLIVLTGAFWPWSWNVESRFYSYLIRQAQGEWPAGAEPPGLAFKLQSAEFSGRKDRPASLIASYQVEGLTAMQGLMPVQSEYTLRWPDGTSATGRSWGRSGLADMMSAHALSGGNDSGKAAALAGSVNFTSAMPAPTMAKVRSSASSYTLPARFRLMRFESVTRVPLEPGTWSVHDSQGERLAHAEKEGPQLLVTFIRHMPSLWVDNAGGGQLAGTGDYSQYFLVNRTRGAVDRGTSTDYRLTRIASVGISWRTMSFLAIPRPPKGSVLDAINALNEAELVKVTFAEQARFSHELKLGPEEIAQANP
ncbi:MAG TPA: hypothetical protein VGD97_12300 [Lacunisphaera sp.]